LVQDFEVEQRIVFTGKNTLELGEDERRNTGKIEELELTI
jgi:hypothetical protein